MSSVGATVGFAFEAAHWLPYVGENHKCRRMHGHSYKVAVTCSGPVATDGMVLDYAEIKEVVRPIIKRYDHTTLNDHMVNPTCENICVCIWDQIDLPSLSAVMVRETD